MVNSRLFVRFSREADGKMPPGFTLGINYPVFKIRWDNEQKETFLLLANKNDEFVWVEASLVLRQPPPEPRHNRDPKNYQS